MPKHMTITKDITSGTITVSDSSGQSLIIDPSKRATASCHATKIFYPTAKGITHALHDFDQAVDASNLGANSSGIKSYLRDPMGLSVTIETGNESVMDHFCAPMTPAAAIPAKPKIKR